MALTSSDIIDLKRTDAQKIVDWLKTRDLHFGQSAFLSLKQMLASRGVNIEMEVLGWQSMVIDILAGALTQFEEGDLLLSMFALSRTAQIHGADVHAVRYDLQDLIDLYTTTCPAGPEGCTTQAIIHIGGDHFAVVTYANANEVRYFETNKGINGEEQKITVAQFMDVWDTGNGTGHLLVFGDQAKTEKTLAREAALRVRGAFLPILFAIFAIASAVLTVASLVVSFFSPKWGRILGFAAMVAGIAGIVSAVANFVVNAAQVALGNITTGIFNAVKQGFQAIGNTVWESVRAVGRYVLKGFNFLKSALTGNLGSLGGFKIANVASYIKEGAKLVFVPGTGEFAKVGQLTLGQKIARMTISAGLEYGVNKGLQGLGIDTRLSGLAGAFIGGGVMGLGIKGSTFFKSGLQRFMLQQVSEIGLHLGLAPPLVRGISIATQSSLSQMFGTSGLNIADFTQSGITTEFKNLITTGTIETLARSFGLDNRFANLISAPLGSLVSGVTTGLFGSGTTNIFNAIKTSLFNKGTLVQSISLGAAALGLGNGFTAGAITGAVSQLLGSPDLLKNTANLVGNLLLHPVKSLSGAINAAQNIFTSMNEKIQQKGLLGALDDWFVQIFDRKTQEEVYRAGGVESVLNGGGILTVFNGEAAKEYSFGNGSSLFTDLTGNMIGKTENGVTQSGTFGLNFAGKFGLITGKIFANMVGGFAFAGEVQQGSLKTGELVQNNQTIAQFSGQGPEGQRWIGFQLPQQTPQAPQAQSGFSWSNLALNLVQAGLSFSFDRFGGLKDIITLPTAYADVILPTPNPGLNLGNILVEALKNNGTLTQDQTQKLKDSFKWLAHYTDAAGFEAITESNRILAGQNGAFLSKEIPMTDSIDLLGGSREEIAMRLQLSYSFSDQINPEKATYFFLIDAENFNDAVVRDVQIDTTKKDTDGNFQQSGITGATEYVFSRTLDIADKIIYSGFNSAANWLLALLKMLQYFINKEHA